MEIIKRVSDYAIRGLIFMAKHESGKIFDLTTVSKATETPLPFLQKIFRKLSKAGYLTTHRGIKGGFSFLKSPEEISVLDIIEIAQGPLIMNQCFKEGKDCVRDDFCGFRRKLSDVDSKYRDLLKEINLQQLISHEINLGHAE